MHTTLATPSASIVIVNVVPPRPATFPLHWTCTPMSVQFGAFAPDSMKCPLCADATPGKAKTAASATTRSKDFLIGSPPCDWRQTVGVGWVADNWDDAQFSFSPRRLKVTPPGENALGWLREMP